MVNYILKTDHPVLIGDFKNDVPKKEVSTIRVFISSTFTDMSEERNALMKYTFPELHAYFRSKRLDFEVVDMRWGVREEMVLDHMASQLCEREIAQAQMVSEGISFIALLGDKYGSCPLPYRIPSDHYDRFLQALQRSNINTDMLQKWYLLDENDLSKKDVKIYVLASLTEMFKFINSNDPQNVELRFQDRIQWHKEQDELRNLLQKAAELCYAQTLISEEEKHTYFMAVTEREISLGILKDPEAPNRALCFIRSFEFFKQSDEFANRYADITDGRIDPKCSLYLNNLKREKIPKKLPPENIFQYKIPWHSKGVCPDEEQSHKNYLTQLCDDVRRAIIEFSERRINNKKTTLTAVGDPKWYSDLLHHGEFCRNRASACVGRSILTLRNRCLGALYRNEFISTNATVSKTHKEINVNDNDNEEGHNLEHAQMENNVDSIPDPGVVVMCHKPLILYGASGCGKTSLVAHLALDFVNLFNNWLAECPSEKRKPIENDTVIKVVRFLGTSPMSCNARSLLESVIMQIRAAIDCDPKPNNFFGFTFSALCEYFETLLWSLKDFKGRIFIVFDAADQLTNEYSGYSMNWIPITFPTNVYMIVSMYKSAEDSNGSDSGSCLSNMKKLLPDESCYIRIDTLSKKSAVHILNKYGEMNNRTFTGFQVGKILQVFENCQEPMYLKLIYELVKDWKSFTDVSQLKFGKNCKEVIEQLFNKLENQHGRTLVYALKYLTAAKEGLTDMEMEDLLSLDDDVLQDVYVYHLPADSNIIRLPPMLWRRIRQQLNEFLTVREADGKVVVNWYHRQFWETAKLHPANNIRIHGIMAEYFSGEWYGRVKPLLLYKGKKAEYNNCSRNVPSMPNCFTNDEPNFRKYKELPYHLAMSYQLDKSADLLTDFDFVMCKLRFTDVKRLATDYRLFFDRFSPGLHCSAFLAYLKEDQLKYAHKIDVQVIEVKIIVQIIQNAVNALYGLFDGCGWSLFAGQIVGRLTGLWLSYPRTYKMYNDAKTWMANVDFPIIIPRFICLQQPGSLLITSIFHLVYVPRRYRDSRSGVYFNGHLLYARGQSWNKPDCIEVYDMTNFAEAIQTIKLHLDIIATRFFQNEKYIIVKTYLSRKQRETKIEVLVNLRTKEKIDLSLSSIRAILLANCEQFFVAIHSNVCTIFDVTLPDDKIVLRGNLEIESESNFFTGSFNLDDTVLMLINESGTIFSYDLARNKVLWKFSMNKDRKPINCLNFAFFQFQFTSDKMICRGICDDDYNRLFVFYISSGEILTSCDGEVYPLDIILIHKSERWVAAATSFNDTIDNVKTKPMFIWDIETGHRLNRVKGNKGSYKSATFLGSEHQYLAFSRQYDPGILIIHVGTPDKRNSMGRLLLKLNGHTKPVACFLRDPLDKMLITFSEDNHFKVWDLEAVLTICDFYEKNDKVPIVKYTDNLKEQTEDEKYAATGCLFGRIVLFNLDSGDFIVVDGHSKQVKRVNCVIYEKDLLGLSSSAEILISSATPEPNIRFWDPVTGKCLKTLTAGLNVCCMAIENGFIYAGGVLTDSISKCTSAVHKYNLLDGSKLVEIQYESRFIFENFALASQKEIICSWNKSKIAIFEFETKNERILSPYITLDDEETDKCTFISCTPKGNYALCGSSRYLHIVNLAKKSSDADDDITVLDCGNNVSCVDFTKDDEYALVGSYRTVHLVHISSGQDQRQFRVHDDFVEAIRMSFSHEYFVTLSKDAFCKLYKFDQTKLAPETFPLAQFSFHCPVRHLAVPEKLNFILVGPETAAPLAILTFNNRLIEDIKQRTPNYSVSLNWTTEYRKTLPESCNIPVTKIQMKLKDDSVDFYDGEFLSLSLTKDMFHLCKSVSSPFSSISSGDNLSCCVS